MEASYSERSILFWVQLTQALCTYIHCSITWKQVELLALSRNCKETKVHRGQRAMGRGMTKEVYKMGEGVGGIQHSPGEGRGEELDPRQTFQT